MSTVVVCFQPSSEQLDTIAQWLIKEYQSTKSGFYVNWENSVLLSFDRGRMAIVVVDGNPIGFVTWDDGYECVIKIQIAEIQPDFRRKGYGRIMIAALLDKFRQDNARIVRLHCQPASSEIAWKKLGFNTYPQLNGFEDYHSANGKHLFQILCPSAQPSIPSSHSETLELWAMEPYQTTSELAKWIWQLEFKKDSRTLTLPIIIPANRNWKIRWTKENVVLKEGGIKNFRNEEIDFSDFIIIENLPLLR